MHQMYDVLDALLTGLAALDNGPRDKRQTRW